MFAREVNESEHIQAALKHVVLAKVDCEKGEGPEIAEKYGVGGYPTFLVVNADGEVTDGIIGYPGDEAWARFAKQSAVDRRTIVQKKAAYESAPTAGLARSLGNHASTSYDFKGAVGYFTVARNLDADHAAEYTEQILTNMYYGSFRDAFTLDEVEAEVKPAFHSPEAGTGDKLQLASMITTVAKSAGEPARARDYLAAAMALEIDPEDEGQARALGRLAVDAALIVDGDADKAVGLMKASLPDDWTESPRYLNRFAWWCFENTVNLDEALEYALKGVELADTDASRAQILDTAAEICNAKGDCSQAVEYMQRAVDIDPENPTWKDQLARFEKLLAEQRQG